MLSVLIAPQQRGHPQLHSKLRGREKCFILHSEGGGEGRFIPTYQGGKLLGREGEMCFIQAPPRSKRNASTQTSHGGKWNVDASARTSRLLRFPIQ